MSNKEKKPADLPEQEKDGNMPEEKSPATAKECIYAILGAAAGALGAILYGLAFSPAGIYGLIGGIVCEIAACGLFRTQKKRRPAGWAKIPAIICYILLALGVVFMTGGIIWASLQKN